MAEFAGGRGGGLRDGSFQPPGFRVLPGFKSSGLPIPIQVLSRRHGVKRHHYHHQ